MQGQNPELDPETENELLWKKREIIIKFVVSSIYIPLEKLSEWCIEIL